MRASDDPFHEQGVCHSVHPGRNGFQAIELLFENKRNPPFPQNQIIRICLYRYSFIHFWRFYGPCNDIGRHRRAGAAPAAIYLFRI
jgi:hypothetical protein